MIRILGPVGYLTLAIFKLLGVTDEQHLFRCYEAVKTRRIPHSADEVIEVAKRVIEETKCKSA